MKLTQEQENRVDNLIQRLFEDFLSKLKNKAISEGGITKNQLDEANKIAILYMEKVVKNFKKSLPKKKKKPKSKYRMIELGD